MKPIKSLLVAGSVPSSHPVTPGSVGHPTAPSLGQEPQPLLPPARALEQGDGVGMREERLRQLQGSAAISRMQILLLLPAPGAQEVKDEVLTPILALVLRVLGSA